MFRERRGNLFGAVLFVGLMALASGCSSGRKQVYRVHGSVLDSKDKPAVGAMVIFHPVESTDEPPLKPLGYVQDDGSFSLTTYTKDDGAPAGEYSVTIEWRPPSSNPFAAKTPGPDRLAGRYSNPAQSKIRLRIEPQPENELPPIHVE